MKYICLGYLEPGKFEGMTEDEQKATLDDGLKVPPRRGSDFSFRQPTPTALLALASASTPSRENRACWDPRVG